MHTYSTALNLFKDCVWTSVFIFAANRLKLNAVNFSSAVFVSEQRIDAYLRKRTLTMPNARLFK